MALTEKWKETVQDGVTNKAWDAYDVVIQNEVNGYNLRFCGPPGPLGLDWKIVKAIIWVETGALSEDWKTRPMQIGNPLDPGFDTLKKGEEGSGLIISDQFKHDLLVMSIDDPKFNIRAGIAYLITRLASFDIRSVDDARDTATYTYQVRGGDNLDKIARSTRTTVPVLTTMNPQAVKTIHPKDNLLYHHSAMRTVITGFKTANTVNIARLYNVGDSNYAEKLNYVLELFKTVKR